MTPVSQPTNLPRVGISACLTGQRVRYDGEHRLQDELLSYLQQHAELVLVCPEVGAGLGVPREPFHLERRPDGELVAITNHTQRDLTASLVAFARQEVERLLAWGLQGFVSKARSPSCGASDTPVGSAAQLESGLFIVELQRQAPQLPIATDVQLSSPSSRASFLDAVAAYGEFCGAGGGP